MRVVVTGASGNVGTSVLSALASDPQITEIVGVARRPAGGAFPKTSWRRGDVSDSPLAVLFDGADVVIHLAWLIQPSRDESRTWKVNVEGSRRVFDAVAETDVPALVYASSVGTYAPHPQPEPVDESWPATGIESSFYSRQKAQVETLLDAFELANAGVRVVRMRPALTFKRDAATEIRRLFIGPLLANRLVRPDLLPAFPYPRGLHTQVVHSDDVGEAYRLAATRAVSGAFNVAADPVLDSYSLQRVLKARATELSPSLLRALVGATWRLRLQPTSPGWLDMGMLTPVMDVARARRELGWSASADAGQVLHELLEGLHDGAGLETPPLSPRAGGPLRWRELATGVGGADQI
jgi:nucleoside-diphosphate-sugar epimerase